MSRVKADYQDVTALPSSEAYFGDAPAIMFPTVTLPLPYKDRIRLLRDQVLVRLIAPERMTASKLLWIPESARRADHEVFRGVVIATGPGARSPKTGALTPVDVAPGDVVVYYFFEDQQAMHWPDENHRILQEGYIQYVETE